MKKQSSWKLWCSVLASAALHLLPLCFALPVLVQQAVPLRATDLQVEVLHEAVAAAGTAEAAEPAPSAPVAAAPVHAVKRREVAPAPVARAMLPASEVPSEPTVSREPEPRLLTEPTVATVPSAATEPSTAAPAAAAAAEVPTGAARSAVGLDGVGADTKLATGAGSGAPGELTGNAAGGLVPAVPTLDLSALRARYLRRLRERVLARREYPHVARRAGLEGTVCLRVSVDAGGRLAQLRPTCAAPAPLLEAALKAVRAAAPFGPLPNELGSEISLDLPMVFQLDAG